MNRTFFFYCLRATFVLLILAMGTATFSLAVSDQEVAVYKVGKATVWGVSDSSEDMDMAVFPSADQEILDQYAPQGRVPAAIMVFVVQIDKQFLLIDTGLGQVGTDPKNVDRLMAGLTRIGLAPEKVDMVLLTHLHPDHIGGLVRDGKKLFPNAKILCNRLEHDFWMRDQSALEFPQNQAWFALARQIMGVYSGATQLFDFGEEVFPGIKALDARGHTPGHTAFQLESGEEQLLFWGDLLHAAALQFPHPKINATYDMNPPVAAATRLRFMDTAARKKQVIAAAHLPFPAIGHVKKVGEDSYSYTPIF